MKRIAIVGAEGAGKTVMLAGLGELFSHPDSNGYYLEPQDIETASYIRRQYGKLRNGEWPTATATDSAHGLNWHLKRTCGHGRSKTIAEVSCLDFAGEVYRAAFNATLSNKGAYDKEAQMLKQFIDSADDLVVLINLRDAISGRGGSDRAVETEFAVLQLLKYVLEDSSAAAPRVLLALSQSDMYSETIANCGGSGQALFKYLPTVANAFGYLDSVAIHVVDKTELNVNGDVVPAKEYSLDGLRPMVDWLLYAPSGVMGWIHNGACGLWRKLKRLHSRLYAGPVFSGRENGSNSGSNATVQNGRKEFEVVASKKKRQKTIIEDGEKGFSYWGNDETDSEVRGVVYAKNRDDAVAKLRGQNIFVMTCVPLSRRDAKHMQEDSVSQKVEKVKTQEDAESPDLQYGFVVFFATMILFALVGASFYWAYTNEGFFSGIGKWCVYCLAWIASTATFFSWGASAIPESGSRYWLMTMGGLDVTAGAIVPCAVYGIGTVVAVIVVAIVAIGGLCALGASNS